MTTYNGWSNYETWAVKLWMDNDEASYKYWQSATTDAWRTAEAEAEHPTPKLVVGYLADHLEAHHTEDLPETGVTADLLRHAFGAVNWREIAEALVEDSMEPNT